MPMCWALAPGPVLTPSFLKCVYNFWKTKLYYFFVTLLALLSWAWFGATQSSESNHTGLGFEPSPLARPWAPVEWLRLITRTHFCVPGISGNSWNPDLSIFTGQRNHTLLCFQTTFIIQRSSEGKWLLDFPSVTTEETEEHRGIMGLQTHTASQKK